MWAYFARRAGWLKIKVGTNQGPQIYMYLSALVCPTARIARRSAELILTSKLEIIKRVNEETEILRGGGGEGWLEGLNKKPQTIYPKIAIFKKLLKSYPLNILKVQSDSSKISNLGQIFIFTENCTPNYPYKSF